VLGLLQLVLVRLFVPESPHRAAGGFDLLGALGLGAGLVGVLLVISKGNEWGWSSPVVIGLLTAAVLIFAGWAPYQLRRAAPLVDLRVSARPAVLLTNLASVLIGYAMFTMFVLTPQILQAPPGTGYGFGTSVLVSGLLLLPIGLSMTVFSPVSARLSRRFSPRLTLLLGAAVAALGNLVFAVRHQDLATLVILVTIIAIGSALAYSALPMLIMAAVPQEDSEAANSLNLLMRTLGTSSCSAVVAALATGITVQTTAGRYPSGVAYSIAFLSAAVAAVGAAVLAYVLPSGWRDARQAGRSSRASAGRPGGLSRDAVPDNITR
jgi:predicted MFS family arabinose efflux permease